LYFQNILWCLFFLPSTFCCAAVAAAYAAVYIALCDAVCVALENVFGDKNPKVFL